MKFTRHGNQRQYCVWSDEDFSCDVSVSRSYTGKSWVTNVASFRRDTSKVSLPAPAFPSGASSAALRRVEVLRLLANCPVVPIGLPSDGKRFVDATPGACADRLLRLREQGYRVPKWLEDELKDEQNMMEEFRPTPDTLDCPSSHRWELDESGHPRRWRCLDCGFSMTAEFGLAAHRGPDECYSARFDAGLIYYPHGYRVRDGSPHPLSLSDLTRARAAVDSDDAQMDPEQSVEMIRLLLEHIDYLGMLLDHKDEEVSRFMLAEP